MPEPSFIVRRRWWLFGKWGWILVGNVSNLRSGWKWKHWEGARADALKCRDSFESAPIEVIS